MLHRHCGILPVEPEKATCFSRTAFASCGVPTQLPKVMPLAAACAHLLCAWTAEANPPFPGNIFHPPTLSGAALVCTPCPPRALLLALQPFRLSPFVPSPPLTFPVPCLPCRAAEVAELVQSALDGYHVCIMSYGQTGGSAPALCGSAHTHAHHATCAS